MSQRFEEREDHSPADQQTVDTGQEVFDHTEFVRDLGTAEDNRIRPLGVGREASENVRLRGDEQSGSARYEFRRLIHAGLFAVNDAETVGHKRVDAVGQQGREIGAFVVHLRGLARIESEVFKNEHFAGCELFSVRQRVGSNRVVREFHGCL